MFAQCLRSGCAVRYGLRMETESNTPEARTYVVGLPVIVTVSPEGYVTVEVDTAELGASIAELDDSEHTDEQREQDAATADAWATVHPVQATGRVR